MTIKLKLFQLAKLFLLSLIAFLIIQEGKACSGYKLTVGNKTVLGCNHDAWFTTPHIWFEQATNGKFGAVFTGARPDGANGYAPQSGMNEMGLAFERLASYHPLREKMANRKTIVNPTSYLKDILHTCQSVEDVKAYIGQYDHSFFIEDVFIYADKSGQYLLVEPYTLTIENKPTYVIANFCPSITTEQHANKLDRYRNGIAFMKNGIDTTLAYCTALLDTMHVCRKKVGDGTLLSTIWDLNNGEVTLYFYHNFKRMVQFNISEELKKGNRSMAIESLFPKNPDFERLRQFKTPKNNGFIGLFILAAGGFFLLSASFFLFQFIKRKEPRKYTYLSICLFLLNIMLFYYMIVLSSSVKVFYFPAPYTDPQNMFVSLTSYLPFLLLLLILPLLAFNYKLLNEPSWSRLAKGLLAFNNLVYFVLIGLFVYWKFYHIFN